MTEPLWLTEEQVVLMHAEQLAIFGGPPGIRDRDMLGSALDRPRNKWAYDSERDLAKLAAAYAFGVARNHPFVDGNKRAAFLCMMVLLLKNGIEIKPSEAEAIEAMQDLAAGDIDEDGLARWIRDNWPG